ncbi:A/G-specific adenine glycosylase [Phytophthora nicotianae INRA-310]|uniref:Adenine DNA glycosylase n=1 Tax=Phytophthora nicotianae (strain INRA-310) TaxID=761204 RepID=W2PZI7_PHYN3|nr:A/G-specific adenine glycosylase [Phytophthora nicotianae INRA-310]ETN05689.1 A/G-specific adenine glycosylase [Phytophthora nicotianae INRA-310]
MPPTATISSTSAACEPDIEDLIKREASNAAKGKATIFSTQHDAKRHDFRPQELLTTRTELLEWYDAHRRKLPWRGDSPPYLTTATHTSQKKKIASKKTGLETFLKKEVENVKLEEMPVATDGGNMLKPRKVAPYETWVSEIMLQQTRVDTVVEYFLRWIDKFPTVAALAEANEEDVNALWAGLGYYRRARMLHAGAKYVVENYGGELPSTVDQLLTIPGIGPYTAGAIASIAFGNREPLVDGNVIRVMARMRAVGADPKNKQLINFSWRAAKDFVGECNRPGALNQALMELGATMCTVQNPRCSDCPVRSVCLAYEEANTVKSRTESTLVESTESSNSCSICDYTRVTEWDESHTEVTKYPLKAKKNDSKNETIAVAVVSAPCGSPTEETTAPRRKRKASKSVEAEASSDWRFLMSKRPEGGLLAGQWEFLHSKMSDSDKIPPFSKRKSFMDSRLTDIFSETALSRLDKSAPERRDLGELTHIFSHVKHHMGVEHVHFKSQPELLPGAESDELRWMTVAEMKQRGITTGVKKILQRVLHPDKATSKKAKATSSATSTVSHVTQSGGKRLKTIASFFKK